MKKICTFLFILLIAGCNSDYDDTALQGRVDDLESRGPNWKNFVHR